MPRAGHLEIDHDMEFQRREWDVQRVGWIAIALVMLAAALGLFGRGPLARASAGSHAAGSPLTLEYERFLRKHSSTSLVVQLAPNATPDGLARVWIDRTYVDRVEIDETVPRPSNVSADADRVVYTFHLDDPARAARVVFELQPDDKGVLEGRIGLASSPPVSFRQLVYP
jgi:hypothetical protein